MRAMSLLLGFAIMIFVTVALTKLGKDSVVEKSNVNKKHVSVKTESINEKNK